MPVNTPGEVESALAAGSTQSALSCIFRTAHQNQGRRVGGLRPGC